MQICVYLCSRQEGEPRSVRFKRESCLYPGFIVWLTHEREIWYIPHNPMLLIPFCKSFGLRAPAFDTAPVVEQLWVP